MTPDYGGQQIRSLLMNGDADNYAQRLLNMSPEESWLRQGWTQGPDGSWSRSTAMRDHIGMVEAQEKLQANHPPRRPWSGS